MTAESRRPDSALRDIDVEAALVSGLDEPGDQRSNLFSDAAIAAALRLAEHGIGPYPVGFLADCVRSMGLAAVLELPEPLIGAEPTEIVRSWMHAAADGHDADVRRDDLFARWLAAVAAVLAIRRREQERSR